MTAKKTNVESLSPPTAVPVAPAATNAIASATVDLTVPLRWKSATPVEQKMLENLQGNILKGHGRDHTSNIFFQFGADALLGKRLLRELGNFHVTSAYKQLIATDKFKATGEEGGTFCSVFISASGYKKLELTFTAPPQNDSFAAGMRSAVSLSTLQDPDLPAWEDHFQEEIHGMVLVADDDLVRGAAEVNVVRSLIAQAGGQVLHTQIGKAIKNSVGNGLEHFGYVDGRSQPLMLVEDIESESRDEGISQWDPTAGLDKALVPDPLAGGSLSFGSFFIFRKLEQRVRDFKTKEQELADKLKLTGDDRELAGALVVGRFEDGTPVTMSDEAKGQKAPRNDFSYDGDQAGSRCPFHAHIRKTNPRGSGGFEKPQVEQLHIMARRGITYEDEPRVVHPDALPESGSMEEFVEKVQPFLPEGGLGLLFMAYNAKLENQFVFTQKNWANEVGFPKVPTGGAPGLDGVIGQADPKQLPSEQSYPSSWDDPAKGTTPFDFRAFVRMKGGEYFFAPSVRFLRNI